MAIGNYIRTGPFVITFEDTGLLLTAHDSNASLSRAKGPTLITFENTELLTENDIRTGPFVIFSLIIKMESEIIYSRSGYEYRYRIGMDDEIISLYRENIRRSFACYGRTFIVEVRTNFVLKPSSSSGAGEQILDSERFVNFFPVSEDDIKILPVDDREMYLLSMGFRLKEYWLPENEIERIVDETFCFAKRTGADPRNASLHVIPVVVHIDVCTVRLPQESLDAAALRSIKPDCLIPFRLFGIGTMLEDGTAGDSSAMVKRMYSLRLSRERVLEEDADVASALMESCPICSQPATYGAQISRLACDHVFHNHCIVRCLMANTKCPVCHFEIVVDTL